MLHLSSTLLGSCYCNNYLLNSLFLQECGKESVEVKGRHFFPVVTVHEGECAEEGIGQQGHYKLAPQNQRDSCVWGEVYVCVCVCGGGGGGGGGGSEGIW